jgi:hypothetical protein
MGHLQGRYLAKKEGEDNGYTASLNLPQPLNPNKYGVLKNGGIHGWGTTFGCLMEKGLF